MSTKKRTTPERPERVEFHLSVAEKERLTMLAIRSGKNIGELLRGYIHAAWIGSENARAETG